jgi:hypothetical protein
MQKITHVHGETYKQQLNYSQKRLSDFDSRARRARAPFLIVPAGHDLPLTLKTPAIQAQWALSTMPKLT